MTTGEQLVDRADGFLFASKKGGRNRVTTDSGTLVSNAETPIPGTCIPWEAPPA